MSPSARGGTEPSEGFSAAEHFGRVAPAYAAHRPTYPARLFDYLAALAPRRELAWDCAAGSGQATIGLAERFARVVATDVSAAQLAAAPAHPRVEYRVAPADRSGLAATSVDLVTVAQALHWLPLEAFYAEVRRVLAPGSPIAVFCYAGATLDEPALHDAFARFHRDRVAPYWPPERRHVDVGYRSLPFPFREIEVRETFEMEASWTLPQLLGYVGTWSAVDRYRTVRADDPVEKLAAAISPLWGEAARPRRVSWPIAIRVGFAD